MRLIHTADWHLRADLPRCRTDADWLNTQRMVIRQIVSLSNQHKAPIAIVGDLFHTSRVPDEVVSMLIQEALLARFGMYVISGNHDLPYHAWENVQRSSFGIIWTLAEAGNTSFHPLWELGNAGNWGMPIRGAYDSTIQFLHRLVFKATKDLPPNVEACTAMDLLEEFPDHKWILTGDMHKSFHFKYGDRHVVNPGCITRQAADFKDYQPVVALIDTDTEDVLFLPLEEDALVVDDAYLRAAEERDERIQAFVETIQTTGAVSLDYLANVEKARQETQLSPATDAMVIRLLEGAK